MRLQKLRATLPRLGVDVLLVSQPENRRYLSGFTGGGGLLLVSADRAVVATHFTYYEQVKQEAPAFELAKVTSSESALLPGLLADLQVRRLGFESQSLTVDKLRTWSLATPGVEWVPLQGVVEEIRAVKDEHELELLRRSTALTDAAFEHLQQSLRPGMTEREAAWQIESYMRTHGASKVAFDLIVAAGPSGAIPHARPSDHPIQAGEPIVIDIGSVIDDYCSDLTRTICLGAPSRKYLEVWEVVRRAQEAVESNIRAGMNGIEIDALARDVITAAGYGEYFGHGLGHGVGLAVHEAPQASRQAPVDKTLEPGMVMTVEPGIYLPGEFGVRLEDFLFVTADGAEIVTRASKMPVVATG